MSLPLSGQRILLTGASRGIGRAIALDLAAAGAELLLVARSAEGLEALAAELATRGGRARWEAADLAQPADRARVIAAARAWGGLTAVVNNAGIEHTLAFVDQTPEEIDQQVAVNLLAPLQLTHALLPELVARRDGAVVMVSSMSGKSATPYNAVYSATKHALQGFCASLAIELEGTGVRVASVCPSFVADAGMWHDTGLQAPPLLREVPLADVLGAVRRGLGRGGEILVTPTPVRPLLAVAALFPSIDGRVLRWLGVLDALRARARANAERRAARAPSA